MDFKFGVATAAYQIEGAAYEDGKGLSIWDTCSKHKGLVRDGHTGDVACDHYHRYEEDIELMKELGIDAYRLSISWPRILPSGKGAINQKGLDFYDSLIDSILEKGITPYITLFHWDLPYDLYKEGGWLNRNIADWFSDYTDIVVSKFSDRVKNWITLNEPQCFIGHGLQIGAHAPFLKLPQRDVLNGAHNALLAHGKSVQAIRAASKQDCIIGFCPVGAVISPETNKKEDIEAARREMFRCDIDTVFNAAWWSDAVFFGKYPEDGINYHGENLPKIKQGDMEIISQPVDFYGVNIYDCPRVYAGENGEAIYAAFAQGFPRTNFDWAVTPEALYWGPKFLYERYKKPIIVTENGLAGMDWVCEDEKVHDAMRIDYMSRYLKELLKAKGESIDIQGYFAWSLLDNFEWAEGYFRRFGIVYVDFETQKRTPKDSYYWYRDYIKNFKNK